MEVLILGHQISQDLLGRKNHKKQTKAVSDAAQKKNQITCWHSRGRAWVKIWDARVSVVVQLNCFIV